MILFDKQTAFILLTSLALAILCILPSTSNLPAINIIATGLYLGETIFHEAGHAIFGWLTGHVSIPAAYTLIRPPESNTAGVALIFDRSILLQCVMIALLIYGSYRLKKAFSWFEIPMYILTCTIIAFAFTSKYSILVTYGGHFTCMLFGSFLLFRGILNLQSRHSFERWLNGLLGWFLLLSNAFLSYRLFSDDIYAETYASGAVFSAGVIGDHDYVKIADTMGLSLSTISIINVFICLLLILLSFALAIRHHGTNPLALDT